MSSSSSPIICVSLAIFRSPSSSCSCFDSACAFTFCSSFRSPCFSFSFSLYSLLILISLSITRLYSVVPKMASNFFFSSFGSSSGQQESSWWQNITLFRMAFETPIASHISLLMSVTRDRVIVTFSFVWAFSIVMVESIVSNLGFLPLCVIFIDRIAVTVLPVKSFTISFTCPKLSTVLNILGSCTKPTPRFVPGGTSPVSPYFRHSMMVVLPQPFWPTISMVVVWCDGAEMVTVVGVTA
uniref:Uncharacterized protein n=1 Tax=Anopheles coluzzii TaxID=1518534 RepID=A0A8W7PB69_ANOCL